MKNKVKVVVELSKAGWIPVSYILQFQIHKMMQHLWKTEEIVQHQYFLQKKIGSLEDKGPKRTYLKAGGMCHFFLMSPTLVGWTG